MRFRKTRSVLILSVVLSVSMASACHSEKEKKRPKPPGQTDIYQRSEPKPQTAEKKEEKTEKKSEEPIAPLKLAEFDAAKMEIGRRLFFDPILSGNGKITCATCHSLEHGGAEPRKTSKGIKGQIGPINSPTVLNAHYNMAQFWDGRAKDLKDQAGGPVENPIEMGAKFEVVAKAVAEDPWYKEHFGTSYEGKIDKDTITDAIAEYEKSLITPSPFDEYLGGKKDAISEEAVRGYALFKSNGCTTCHLGMNVGGSTYQKMGLVEDYFKLRGGKITEADLGRFNVTKKDEDKHFFKVPTLRNIANTAPYFHDGSQEKLDEAVKIMAKVQFGKTLKDEEVKDIVAFLNTLSGKLPETAKLPADQVPKRK